MQETDIAAQVIAWFQARDWDVYQEVQIDQGEPIADIVAVMGPRVWVVECKKTLSLDLMAQALHWQRYAHWVSIAVPAPKRMKRWLYVRVSRGRELAIRILRSHGVGVMLLVTPEHGDPRIKTEHKPTLERHNISRWYTGDHTGVHRRQHLQDIQTLRGTLAPEHKTFATAGSAGGQHWSKWQDTCERAAHFVESNPGCSLTQLVDGITHHYASDSSARAALSQWIRQGKLPTIECRREGRRLSLYPRK